MSATASNQAHLARVSSKIGDAILAFCRGRTQFHMQELVDGVQDDGAAIAPDSASRILRDLRAKGVLNYRVLSRRNSHYELLPLTPIQHAPAPPPRPSKAETGKALDEIVQLLRGQQPSPELRKLGAWLRDGAR